MGRTNPRTPESIDGYYMRTHSDGTIVFTEYTEWGVFTYHMTTLPEEDGDGDIILLDRFTQQGESYRTSAIENYPQDILDALSEQGYRVIAD